MFIRASLLFLLSFFFVFNLKAEERSVSYENLQRLVRERNLRVKAAWAKVESARRKGGSLGRSFTPAISVEAGHEVFRTGTEDRRSEPFGSAEAHLNLYQGGRDRLDSDIVNADIQNAESEYQEVLRSELLKAKEIFWGLAFQREMIQATQDAIEHNTLFLKAANRKINSGLSTSTDRIEFDIFRRQLDQDLAVLRSESFRSEKALAFYVMHESPVETPAMIPHDHDDPLLNTVLDARSHPSVAAMTATLKREEFESQKEAGWWRPSLNVFTNYSLYTFREREFDSRSDRDETVAGGRVSLSLFDGGRSRRNAQALQLAAEGTALKRDYAELEIALEVRSDKEWLQQLHDLVHSADESVSLAEDYMKKTLIEYDRGIKNSPDLLGALEKVLEAKKRFAEIRLHYQQIKARLTAALIPVEPVSSAP